MQTLLDQYTKKKEKIHYPTPQAIWSSQTSKITIKNQNK